MIDLVRDTLLWLTDAAHWSGRAGIPSRLLEHVLLVGVALAVAVAIALPIGLWVGHARRGGALAANLANLGRALPSLAVMGIVLPLTVALDPQLGFTVYPALIALVILAIPSILINAMTGIGEVDRELVEAARGTGMREDQVLRRVEIPIALPVILGGIRSGAVQIVATATLAAIFGGPGLGRYLVEGNAQRDAPMLWAGVVLVALLSIATELGFGAAQRLLTSPGLRAERLAAATPGRSAAAG